jgi:competence protein ComEA
MLYSLFMKLGMFVVTLGVVFWIGWTLPTSFDRIYEREASSSEGVKVERGPDPGQVAAVSPAPAASLPAPSLPIVPKRSHDGLLDLNRATEQDFDALPGIGPKLAERIMEYRQSVGAFHALDELREVKGIGKKKFERIRPLVTVTPDGSSIAKGKKTT